jgi:hypothetical protein
MLDFMRDDPGQGDIDAVNWFAVYGYSVDYWPGSMPLLVDGTITPFYEDRYEQPGLTGPRPAVKQHAFQDVFVEATGPRPKTGVWTNPDVAPDQAVVPVARVLGDPDVNPSLDTNDIRRVIDHTTIIMDDEYHSGMWSSSPDPDWVRRDGYSGGCWSAPGVEHLHPIYWMSWSPNLGATGLWNYYIYMTQPQGGDVMNENTLVATSASPSEDFRVNQSVGDFNVWRFLGTRQREAGVHTGLPFMQNCQAYPIDCRVYMDALKMEYAGPGDGGGPAAGPQQAVPAAPFVRVVVNPVVGAARFTYMMPQAGGARLGIYDVTGRSVRTVGLDARPAGIQCVSIPASGLPAGTYMARVSVNGVSATCRFVVCR